MAMSLRRALAITRGNGRGDARRQPNGFLGSESRVFRDVLEKRKAQVARAARSVCNPRKFSVVSAPESARSDGEETARTIIHRPEKRVVRGCSGYISFSVRWASRRSGSARVPD